MSDKKFPREPRCKAIKNDAGDRSKRFQLTRPNKTNLSQKLISSLMTVKTRMKSRRSVVANRHASHAFTSESAKRYTRSTWM